MLAAFNTRILLTAKLSEDHRHTQTHTHTCTQKLTVCTVKIIQHN